MDSICFLRMVGDGFVDVEVDEVVVVVGVKVGDLAEVVPPANRYRNSWNCCRRTFDVDRCMLEVID